MKQMSIYDYPEYLPDKPKEVNIKGICDDGYCPVCDSWVDDLIPECPYCGQKLSWNGWSLINNIDKGVKL